MEQPQGADLREIDVANMGVLLGVAVASFVVLGVIIYFFGEDQSSSMSIANNPPALMTERMMRNKTAQRAAVPNTVGQASVSQIDR